MCDICTDAAKDIAEFAISLVEKYPGTVVDGVEVLPTHHVTVGLQVVADIFLEKEAQFMNVHKEVSSAQAEAFGSGGFFFNSKIGNA
jgi:hypothetical protein